MATDAVGCLRVEGRGWCLHPLLASARLDRCYSSERSWRRSLKEVRLTRFWGVRAVRRCVCVKRPRGFSRLERHSRWLSRSDISMEQMRRRPVGVSCVKIYHLFLIDKDICPKEGQVGMRRDSRQPLVVRFVFPGRGQSFLLLPLTQRDVRPHLFLF